MICRCPREPRLNYARLSTKRSGVVTQGQTNIDLSSARPSMGPLDPQSWRGHIGCEPRKYDQKGGRRCDTKSMIICFFIFVFYQSGSKEIDNGHVIAKPPVEFRRRSMQFFFQVLENWIFSCGNPIILSRDPGIEVNDLDEQLSAHWPSPGQCGVTWE